MQNIIPVSHLKNYSKVVKNVMKNRPVFLTHNGTPTYVLLNLEDYEELLDCREYLLELTCEALEKNGNSDKEKTENIGNKPNKTTDNFYESIHELIDDYINAPLPQSSDEQQQSETDEIWEVLVEILKGMSVICDLIEKMFFDIYGVKIDSFKGHHKESKWK